MHNIQLYIYTLANKLNSYEDNNNISIVMGWRTWDSQFLHCKLHPWGDGSEGVLHTVIEEEWV